MFLQSVVELFSNAAIHSQTKLGVFTCGQFFPRKEELSFTLADFGIGMRQKLKDALNLEFTSVEAITWCTTNHNMTRRGALPGG